jgi:hypothetical protein
MAYTIAQVETALISKGRLGLYLSQMGVDITVAPNDTSPRPVFADAINSALIFAGIFPVNPNAPSDADIATLPQVDKRGISNWLKVVDVAQYEFVLGYFTKVSTGSTSRQWDHYKATSDNQSLVILKDQLEKMLRQKYGYGGPVMETGTIKILKGHPFNRTGF